jgi:hypothetical protein
VASPAAICFGVEFWNISATERPVNAPPDRYKTRYLFMSATSYYFCNLRCVNSPGVNRACRPTSDRRCSASSNFWGPVPTTCQAPAQGIPVDIVATELGGRNLACCCGTSLARAPSVTPAVASSKPTRYLVLITLHACIPPTRTPGAKRISPHANDTEFNRR